MHSTLQFTKQKSTTVMYIATKSKFPFYQMGFKELHKFKQATRAGAKPQPEERSLFKKNRDILTLNQPPSTTQAGFEKNGFNQGGHFPSFAAISPLPLFPPFVKKPRDKNVQNVSQNSPILQQFRCSHYFHLLQKGGPPFCSNFGAITISTFT